MHVPGKSGQLAAIEIDDIKPATDSDALVRSTDGKQFYVEFKVGTVFRAKDLPILVVPNCKPDQGWWLMPDS